MQRVLFGDYLPDLPSHLSEALAIAENVVPVANGYAPVGQFAPAANGTLPGPCLGAGACRYAGSTFIFAGTGSNIYRYTTSGFASVKSGLGTTTAIRFCSYGKSMLATNGIDPIQTYDCGLATSFAALGGGAPVAGYLGVVRGFVVAGFAGGNSLRVQWSDTGNPASWTPGGASLAGQFDMPSGGDITGVVGGEYGLIFQERRIVRMSFTGDDAIWQFDEISANTGCVAPQSLVTWGRLSFFLSDKGWMMCDGNEVTPIGDQKIDKSFLSRAQNGFFDAMSAAIDPVNSLLVISIPSTAPTTELFLYSFLLGRWSSAKLTVERMLSSFGLNATIEELDAIYGSIDAMTASLDSPQFKGGRPVLMLFDGAHRLGTLSGPNAAATVVDARRELAPGQRARLRSVRPLTNAAAPQVLVYGRANLAGSDHVSVYTRRTGGGLFPTREAWSLMQVGLSMPAGADWTYVQGFDADAVGGGRP